MIHLIFESPTLCVLPPCLHSRNALTNKICMLQNLPICFWPSFHCVSCHLELVECFSATYQPIIQMTGFASWVKHSKPDVWWLSLLDFQGTQKCAIFQWHPHFVFTEALPSKLNSLPGYKLIKTHSGFSAAWKELFPPPLPSLLSSLLPSLPFLRTFLSVSVASHLCSGRVTICRKKTRHSQNRGHSKIIYFILYCPRNI